MDKFDESKALVDKSIEAFTMGLEIYNKPTIQYRVEGFSFFICNAWELMLKAELLNRNISIYFKNDLSRTLSLSDVIKSIYSDDSTRIRLNLNKIIDLRNISTHYITQDYEIKYASLFQACVTNFKNEIKRFHDIDLNDYIPLNFLFLSINYNPLSNEEIKMKYPAAIAEKLIKKSNDIEISKDEYNSDKFSIDVRQNLFQVKDKKKSDFAFYLGPDGNNPATIKREININQKYKYSFNNVVDVVRDRMNKKNMKLDYNKGFNKYVLKLFINFHDVKNNKRYAFAHKIDKNNRYTYSEQLITFIIDEIKKDKNFFASLKDNKKR